MAFVLRWLATLALLAFSLLSLAGMAAGAAALLNAPIPLPEIEDAAAAAGAGDQTWLDVGLLLAAGLLFFIAAVRFIRQTQAFVAWLLGFACYAGRWVLAQGDQLMARLQEIDIAAYSRPAEALSDLAAPQAQAAVLAVLLLIGLIALFVDGSDRAYWNAHGE